MSIVPKPVRYVSRVISKEKVSSKVYVTRFSLTTPQTLAFRAGQNVMLYIAPGVNRAMSIASPPQEADCITLAYDVSPMGPGSRWMIRLAKGDTVEFLGPLGIFTMDKQSPRRKLLIATGTGVAPYRAMLYDCIANGGLDDISLYWGLRYEEDVFWNREFQTMAKKHPAFRYVLTLSKPTPVWRGYTGWVTDHVFVDEQQLDGIDFYLCGSKTMVVDMRDRLMARNVPKERIKTELFY